MTPTAPTRSPGPGSRTCAAAGSCRCSWSSRCATPGGGGGGGRRVAGRAAGRAEVAELVGPDRADDLLERSGGNPLLLTELARAGAGPTRSAGSTARGRRRPAPPYRRRRAHPPGRRRARRDDRPRPARRRARSAPLDVLEQLDVGVRQAFLAEREGELAFRHELVRRAVAAGDQRGPAGLAAPAGGRGCRGRGRTALRSSWPGTPARAATATSRPRGWRTPPTSRAAALDLAGAERLLDEAIALQDGGPLRLRRSRVRMSRGDLDGADADAVVAMATDATGEALELRAWAARNRHDLDGAIRLGRAAADAATDPTIRASSLIAVAFGHRGNGDLRAGRGGARGGGGRADRSSGCRRGSACCGCTRAGPPTGWPPWSRCSAPRRAAAGRASGSSTRCR